MPERFELGTLPYELLAGVTAAVDFIAGLDPDAPPTAAPAVAGVDGRRSRRTRTPCSTGCSTGWAPIDGVTLHGRPARRTPTVLFSVDGRTGARGARGARDAPA